MSWGWQGGFQDDDDEEEESGYQEGNTWGNKDSLIFLIDCTEPMFTKDDDDDEQMSPFELSLQCVTAAVKQKIISSEKDLTAVVFFGTDKQKNPSDFKHVYIFQELDMLDAERILQLESLLEDDDFCSFKTEYGHNSGFSLSNVLWTCYDMFSRSSQKIGHKRIMLFTNTDAPHAENGDLERQAITKAKDLAGLGISIELMPIQSASGGFDIAKFYKEVIVTDADEDTGALPDPSEKFDELLNRVRQKDHKKRSLGSITLQLSEGVELAVSVYNLCQSATKPAYVTLDSRSNEEVRTRTTYICEDTGQPLLPQDIKYYQDFGGERAIFEKQEVDGLKQLGSQGLLLMGFKPRSSLKPHFHIRTAQFIYPEEKNITGSSKIFSALLQRCLVRDVIAICRYIPRQNAAPKFVALVPQEEIKDEKNRQIQSPGFNVIFLPFAEDFRKLKYEHVTANRASPESVQMAKDIIAKLTFKYQNGQIENPSLQKLYRTLEALALDKEFDEDELEDMTEPHVSGIDKKIGRLVAQFKAEVFPEGYDPEAKPAPKRKAPAAAGAAKKPKVEVNVDVQEEARSGRLNKLTVPVLKEFARSIGLKCGTKKSDIIDAINDHFGIS